MRAILVVGLFFVSTSGFAAALSVSPKRGLASADTAVDAATEAATERARKVGAKIPEGKQ